MCCIVVDDYLSYEFSGETAAGNIHYHGATRFWGLSSKIADASSSSLDWYARVPTKANWADKPSRLDFSQLLSLGAILKVVQSPDIGQLSGVDVGRALSRAIKSRHS